MSATDQALWSAAFAGVDPERKGWAMDEEIYNERGMEAAGLSLPFLKTLVQHTSKNTGSSRQ